MGRSVLYRLNRPLWDFDRFGGVRSIICQDAEKEKSMIAGVQQMMDQGPNWTEVISCLAAIAAVVSTCVIWWVKHGKAKNKEDD